MTATKSWTCPTCNRRISTPYCPACGERPLNAHDLTLRGLLNQVFHAFSNIDSRLIRTFRNLAGRPVAFVRGQRMLYTGPFQLFLIANVLFFAMQSLTNTDVVSSKLDSHLHNQDWSVLAQRLVSHRLEEMRTTQDLYTPIFNLAACAIYLYIATGRVYGGNRIIRALKVAVLAPAVASILLGYRFAIFLITLYST